MANSKFDSKSFNAEAFKYMVDRVPNLNLNELKKSRALAGNPDIRGVFTAQNGTAYARLAMRGLIDGDAVNYDGQTDITATSTSKFSVHPFLSSIFTQSNTPKIASSQRRKIVCLMCICRYLRYS